MQQQKTFSGNRMAKNTIILYLRTILLMLISLYTSRVVLQTLGEIDFGIYNIVGGVVVLFTFINNAMSTSTQRFLNFELGRGDEKRLIEVFNISLSIHFLIALLILLLGETIGLWFLNNKINIPGERMDAARIVYQLSLAACIANVLRVPYNASIIAYEKMSFYGLISLAEGVLKLIIVFLLLISQTDKLILYSAFTLGVTIIISFAYKIYCNRKFDCTHFHFVWNKILAKQLVGFSSWSLLGSVSIIAINQGVGIIFNIFVGVIVNATIGIVNQVNAAIYSFVSNFQTAFIPQLIKTYAAGYKEEFNKMLNNTARYSFLLLFVISYPIYMECDFILDIWLVDVPQLAVSFTRVILLANLFDALSGPLWSAVQATGKIRTYQFVVSLLFLSSLPLCYIGLKIGLSVTCVFAVKVLISAIVFTYRLLYVKKELRIRLRLFIHNALLKVAGIIVVSAILAGIISYVSPHKIINIGLYFIAGCLLTAFIGLNHRERKNLNTFITHRLSLQKK